MMNNERINEGFRQGFNDARKNKFNKVLNKDNHDFRYGYGRGFAEGIVVLNRINKENEFNKYMLRNNAFQIRI